MYLISKIFILSSINRYGLSSKKQAEGETEWEAEQRQKSRCIWMTGQRGLTEHEAAILIVEEAKKLLQEDLGVHHIHNV